MKRFEFLDHTADIGVRIFGHSQADLFQNAGLALFEIITDISSITEKEKRCFDLQRDFMDE